MLGRGILTHPDFSFILNYMASFSFPVIDVEKTSLKLKKVREKKKIKIGVLQKLFNFDHPQAIYEWDRERRQ